MPFNTPLPNSGTNPWYAPFKTAWDALVSFVNGLETRIDEIPPAGDPDWDDVQNKPSTFPPASHSHVQADVTGLGTALAGKAATSHTHTQGDVTGLTAALALKADKTQIIVLDVLDQGETPPAPGVYLRRPAP